MTDLSKLNETIKELENQAEILKHNNKVLAKVSELAISIEKGVNELSVGNKNFDGVKKDIQTSLQRLNDSVENIEKQNEKHIEVLITSNKKFLRELEDTTSSKLERFSSDIQVTIRQERTQLQESLQNNISSQFNNQKGLFESMGKQITFLKILLFIVIALCIGLGIKLFL